MKGKTVIKILLDLMMTVLYALLVFVPNTGHFFHEVIGIGIGILFILHVALNWNRVKGLRKAVSAGSASKKGVFMLILDLLLPIGMTIVIVTGILISEVLFSVDTGTGWTEIYQIHNAAAYVCFVVLALHLLMHAKYLVAVTKQMIACWNDSNVKRAAVSFASASLAVGVLYLLTFSTYRNSIPASTSSVEVFAPITSSSQAGTTQSETQTGSDSASSTTESTVTAKKKDPGETSTATTDSSGTQGAAISLTDYLSKLYCTGCHNHCPLSNPQCGKSAQLIEEATADYKEEYSIA